MTKIIISKNIYNLPFEDKLNLMPEPAPYHQEKIWQAYALDFAMPKGTLILAAANGIIHLIVDKYNKGGPDKSLAPLCNKIIIKHPNGEYTNYVHLKKGSIVKEGDKVKKGQIIGYAGLTGYTSYPHLHFAVMIKGKKFPWQTIIPRFKIKNKIIKLLSPKD